VWITLASNAKRAIKYKGTLKYRSIDGLPIKVKHHFTETFISIGNINYMKKILTGAVILSAMPLFAYAQGTITNIDGLIETLIGWVELLVPFLITLATLFFFWGLAKFILNAGDEEARKQGKDIMIWGVVAFFVMVSFWGLVGFIGSTLGLEDAVIIDAPSVGGLVPSA